MRAEAEMVKNPTLLSLLLHLLLSYVAAVGTSAAYRPGGRGAPKGGNCC